MYRNALTVLRSASLFMLCLALVVSAAGMLGGCGSNDPSKERSAKAVAGLRETRDELAASRAQIDKTQAALDRLQSAQGDLAWSYNAYKDEVKATEDRAKSAATQAMDMQARGSEYQAKWAQEVSQVSDPTLRATAQQRAAKVQGRYVMISAKAQTAQAAYQPYIRDLKDVQTFLSMDLTPAGIQTAGPVFQKARTDGQVLRQKIDDLSAELDSVASQLAPAK